MDATIHICITNQPITHAALPEERDCGAVLYFYGVVRGEENGGSIAGLDYEAYQPMAEREIGRIIREVLISHPCRFVSVTHRIGFVPVGEASIVVRVAAAHRQEAISFLAEFMNLLKQDVPIWKKTSP